MRTVLFILLFSQLNLKGQMTENTQDELYLQFTQSYDDLDAEKIAHLYTSDAVVLNLYNGAHPNSLNGTNEIRQYFQNFFHSVKSKGQKLILTFKIIDRRSIDEMTYDNGYYRLEFVTPGRPSQSYFGKLSTVLEKVGHQYKFKIDGTTNTDFIEYENARKATIPNRTELLNPTYYDELLGNYVTENNQIIVIGRSQTRLYAYFEHDFTFRGLNKMDANTWTLGESIISKDEVQTLKFRGEQLEFYENGKHIKTAIKKSFYKNEKVTFKNAKGISLGGTIFIPERPNGKGIVLTHGSGPQDRNGYASIIRLLADQLAKEGITVLTYDKQGVGQSEGNYETQNFADLAQDALAGINHLGSNNKLTLSKIGLGGSSQAGWIIAKAIEQSPLVDFALTIGAAGSGLSVEEQNLYNTEVTMKCSNTFTDKQITKALQQQKYFFEYLKDNLKAEKLDKFTRSIAGDTLLREWLFPMSAQVDLTNRNQWFTALEIAFDPLQIWKNFKNPSLMVFSQHDDSTPSDIVKLKVDQLKNKNIETVIIPNAQHIGIETDALCKGEINELNRFHPDFFKILRTWVKGI